MVHLACTQYTPVAPASSNASACVRPSPRAAPDTKMTLPLRLNSGSPFAAMMKTNADTCSISDPNHENRKFSEDNSRRRMNRQNTVQFPGPPQTKYTTPAHNRDQNTRCIMGPEPRPQEAIPPPSTPVYGFPQPPCEPTYTQARRHEQATKRVAGNHRAGLPKAVFRQHSRGDTSLTLEDSGDGCGPIETLENGTA